MEKPIEIGEFPLYWRTKSPEEPDYESETKTLNFQLFYDKKYGFFKQVRTDKLKFALEEVYLLDSNIGYLQEGAEEFQTYGAEYLNLIHQRLYEIFDVDENFKVIDIGCGGGLILDRIKGNFSKADVIGIDPSPIAKKAGIKYDFKIIDEFYPTVDEASLCNSNVVLHYDVLEHVENPFDFLSINYRHLTQGGILIFSVPDCGKSISHGDISMCIHEHLNYFSSESLENLVKSVGFKEVIVTEGIHGGTLFCCAKKLSESSRNTKTTYKDTEGKFLHFKKKSEVLCLKLLQAIYENRDKNIGFYVPLRAIPYIVKLNIDRKFVFFDDSRFFHRRVLDGFESFEILGINEIKQSGVETIFVMSHAYSKIIQENIKNRHPEVKVILLESFYEI